MAKYREFAVVAFVIGVAILGIAAYTLWAAEAAFDRGVRVDALLESYATEGEMAQYSRSNRRPAQFDRTPYYAWMGVGGVAILGAFFLLGLANVRQPSKLDGAASSSSSDDPTISN